MFLLCAYKIFELSDIMAIKKLLEICGHNMFCPCQSCLITGTWNLAERKTNYYVPLVTPKQQTQTQTQTQPHVNVHSLPLQTHIFP
ncbi:hypothetical protein JVU11DRAFT_8882 [Chiua virens]|nr:hypothetical protein JVU11DRAFT_8882 [Chiua virens]